MSMSEERCSAFPFLQGFGMAVMGFAGLATAQTCEWSPAGMTSGGFVEALATVNGDLYAGGWFTSAQGAPGNRIARWDGQMWSPLGNGITTSNAFVASIIGFQGDLHVGGRFTSAGGTPANRIAKWDGTSWSQVGGGVILQPPHNGEPAVHALAVFDGGLYVGGAFSTAGGVPDLIRIARWDGQTWSPLGSGMNSDVYALAAFDGALYAGGNFNMAGGVPANQVARWDGQSWSALGSGTNEGPVYAITEFRGDLFIGGHFADAGGVPGTSGIARWDGGSWSEVGGGISVPLFRAVFDFAVLDDELHVGGFFHNAGGVPGTACIAKWDDQSWSALGTGLDNTAYGLAAFEGELYAGGAFTSAGGVPAHHIARWHCPLACYADCDGDASLTLADFGCFQTKFALGEPYADCNGDAALNLADFGCFQTKFTLGCP